MKKPYSLDYSIERDVDRLEAVKEILDTLDKKPSNSELEQMASYILYGKDENGLNAVKRGEVTDSNKRYDSFTRAADKNQSLDEILDNPLADQQSLKPVGDRYIYTKKRQTIKRPKYDKEGNLVDIGDGDIPGIEQIWDSIDRLEHILAVNEGKVPPDDHTQIITDPYRVYQLKHSLIDVRRHQYYLKDAYKPALHFLAINPPKAQTYNWDSDAAYWMPLDQWQYRVDHALLHRISRNLEDYETRINDKGETEVKWVVRRHIFDWENPYHIRQLINYYSAIYMEVYDKMDSWGRTLIYDFDRYFDMCNFSPVRAYILLRKIDKANYPTITQEIQKKFGIKYNENHLSNIINREIPNQMAIAAKKHRLITELTESNAKRCCRCGRVFPRDPLFFTRNRSHSDGYASACKECEKARRIQLGGQGANDKRIKDSSMLKMPTGET